jgi:uncharacterized protein YbaR (Trm112 family)
MVGGESEIYHERGSPAVKRRLLDILACPVCRHHPLELKETKVEGEEIEAGSLTCPNCHAIYPITDGIPDMLPPQDR